MVQTTQTQTNHQDHGQPQDRYQRLDIEIGRKRDAPAAGPLRDHEIAALFQVVECRDDSYLFVRSDFKKRDEYPCKRWKSVLY